MTTKRIIREVVSWVALIVAVFCLLGLVTSLPRVLGHFRTSPAFALGELTGPLILGVLCLFLYRWGQRPAAK